MAMTLYRMAMERRMSPINGLSAFFMCQIFYRVYYLVNACMKANSMPSGAFLCRGGFASYRSE